MIIGILDTLNCPLSTEAYRHSIRKYTQYGGLILRSPHLNVTDYERELVDWLSFENTQLVVHGHGDLALKYNLKRLHLPYASFLKQHHHWHEKGLLLSTSVHSVEEAIIADALGAHAIIVGNVYATTCKPDLPAKGIDFFKEVITSVSCLVYAIGGVKQDDYQFFLNLGASGICVRSDLWSPIKAQ